MGNEEPVKKSKNQLKREAKWKRRLENNPKFNTLKKKNKRSKRPKNISTAEPSGGIAIDLSFSDLMTYGENASLASQLSRIYAINRRSSAPFSLHFCDSEFFFTRDNVVKKKFPDCERWSVTWTTKIPPVESCVYLTADSPNVLTSIDPDKVYIMGGLVDRNRHKGATFAKAEGLNMATARLPLRESSVSLESSHILTLLHAFEIISKFRECNDWKQSIETVIPKRKLKIEHS